MQILHPQIFLLLMFFSLSTYAIDDKTKDKKPTETQPAATAVVSLQMQQELDAALNKFNESIKMVAPDNMENLKLNVYII